MNQDSKNVREQMDQGAGFVFLVEELKLAPDFFASTLKIFEKLSQASKGIPHFFFQKSLDLVNASEIFMGFDPIEKISIVDGVVKIEKEGDCFEVAGPPFQVIAQRLEKFKVPRREDLPFVQGGAFGYFGYDSVRFVEPILKNHKGAFKKIEETPSFVDGSLILFKKFIMVDCSQKKVFVLAGQAVTGKNIEESARDLRRDLDALKNSLTSAFSETDKPEAPFSLDEEVLPQDLKVSLGQEKFFEGVRRIKSHIAAGDIFQAVLSERFQFENTVDPLELFKTLATKNISAYQFYFFDGHKTYFGASPEMLLSIKNRELESHPIAGTRPRGKDAASEAKLESQLKASPKERAEHLMLVDLARNDLGRIAVPGTVRVTETMALKKFPGVMHLVSVVKGQLKAGENSLTALGACFPAGTLSGAPKIRAMQILSEIEEKPRGFYGGAVVLQSFIGDLDSCISIRSVEIEGAIGFIQAGAGIVADSNPQREYEEILHKTKTLRQVIALKRGMK